MTGILSTLEAADRELLNVLQDSFPIEREPFRVLGERLGISADEALRRTIALQEAGLVRSISGIFDAAGLGYRSTLVAMHVEEGRLDAAAGAVSAHPGVSHNYARNHYFNLWFTLSLPAEENAARAIADLAKQAGAAATVDLPALRVFKLRVYFDMAEQGEAPGAASATGPAPGDEKYSELTIDDKRVVKQLCQELPLVGRPFDELAERAGLDAEYFIASAQRLQRRGVMRRLSAVLRHRKAGFVANAMTCWQVPADRVAEAGAAAARRKEVSHCYQRRTAPDWPYNLFAMIHGRTAEECRSVADAISRDIGIADYVQLYSSTEYKKEKVRYFEGVA